MKLVLLGVIWGLVIPLFGQRQITDKLKSSEKQHGRQVPSMYDHIFWRIAISFGILIRLKMGPVIIS